jgi:thiol:disulfide interchange protein DsbC
MKLFSRYILSLSAGLLMVSNVYASDAITIQDIAKNVPFSTQGVEIVKETPVGNGIYEVVVKIPKTKENPQAEFMPYVVVYASKDFVIAGNLFKNKQNLTMQTINQYMQPVIEKRIKNGGEYAKTHLSELNALSVAQYKSQKANGKILFVFTDPACPACKESNKNLINIANKTGYTIKIIPMASHQESIPLWNGFICGHKNFQDFVTGNYKPADKCQSTMNYVGNASQLANKMGIFATPTFVTSDGKVIVGDNLSQLEALK